MSEVWVKTDSLECFSSEEKIADYHNGYLYTRCYGGSRCTERKTGKIVGKADCEEDPILSSSLCSNILYTAHKSKLIRYYF